MELPKQSEIYCRARARRDAGRARVHGDGQQAEHGAARTAVLRDGAQADALAHQGHQHSGENSRYILEIASALGFSILPWLLYPPSAAASDTPL